MSDSGIHPRRPLHGKGEKNEDPPSENGKLARPAEKQPLPTTSGRRRSMFMLALVVIIATSILYKTYSAFPRMDEQERSHIKLPMNMNDARNLGLVLTKYKEDHYPQVLSAVIVTYICLQTFAIPGSIFLTLLSGYLFSTPTAMILVCSCSAIGASLCYGLSHLVGTNLVEYLLTKYVKTLRELVDKHREHMLNYILFLRITPFVPNWLINIASPVVDVDLIPFALGTFLGVAPPSYFFIQAGTTLNELTDNINNFTTGKVLFLAALAILSLLPVIFKRKLKKYV